MSLKRINFFYEIFFFGSLLFCTGCSPSKLDNPNDLGSKNFLEIEFIKCYLGQDGAVCRKSVNQAINFSGLSSTKILNSSQILLGWNAATSSETSAGNILYDVYRSTTSGTQNFSSPVFTTALGATSATISGLTNTNDYYFVVRARDILGNSDTNTIQKTVLLNGLVRYYNMDSTTATIGSVNLSIGGGSPNLVNGFDNSSNAAYRFNGATPDWLTASDSTLPLGSSARTICSWFKSSSISANLAVWAYGTTTTDQAMGIGYGAGTLTARFFFWGSTNFDLPNTLTSNQWTHICGAYSGTIGQIYINGAIAGQSNSIPVQNTVSNNFRLALNLDGGGPYTGDIDEMKIYNYVLSSEQIGFVYASK